VLVKYNFMGYELLTLGLCACYRKTAAFVSEWLGYTGIMKFSDPPSVTPIPEEGLLEVQLGEEIVIGCKASGVPHPIVTWSNEVQCLIQQFKRAYSYKRNKTE